MRAGAPSVSGANQSVAMKRIAPCPRTCSDSRQRSFTLWPISAVNRVASATSAATGTG